MKKKKILMFLLALLLIPSVSYTSARLIGDYVIPQNVQLDTVDVALAEQMHHDDELVTFHYEGTVVPLQEVEKVTSIENKGAECYVRVKMEIVLDKEKVRNVTDDEFIHRNDQFVLHDDGYYYLSHSLKEGEKMTFMDGIIMPEKELHEYQDNDIHEIEFETTVEAIQTRNFIQDLSSEKPWKGTVIQKCIVSRIEGDIE